MNNQHNYNMNVNNNNQKEESLVYKKIINNKLLIILILTTIVIINVTKKIKHLENSIDEIMKNITENKEELNYKSLILKQQFEAILSYLYNIKNSSSIYQLLKPKTILGKKKIRIGNDNDGGYILLNDFKDIKIAYSFGISNEISFDKYLADKNIDIFMYDHTIEKLPFQNKRFHWKKIGLTDKFGKEDNKKTLYELIKENGHSNIKNMILKIDIEGEEWKIFNDISTDILTQFKYIIVEFHFSDKIAENYLKVFTKINISHQIFHLHCNNAGPLIYFDNNIICSLLEISFIIKENNNFINNNDFFPIKNIDNKNILEKIDINLFLNIYQIDNLYNLLNNSNNFK